VVCKWSKDLSNAVPIIIRIYVDLMKFTAYMAASFIPILSYSFGPIYNNVYSIYGFMFYMLLFNFANYVFLLSYSYCCVYVFLVLCILIVMYVPF
jgi:hypothetical protein